MVGISRGGLKAEYKIKFHSQNPHAAQHEFSECADVKHEQREQNVSPFCFRKVYWEFMSVNYSSCEVLVKYTS